MNATIETIDNTTLAQRLKYLLQANNISPLALAQAAQVGEEFVFEALRGKAQMPYFWTRCFACLGVTPEQAKAQFGIVCDKHAIPVGGLPLLVKGKHEEGVEVKKKRKSIHADRADRLKELIDSKKIRVFEMVKDLGIERRIIDAARSTGCTTPRSWALILTYLGVTKAQASEWGIPWEDASPTFPPSLPKPIDCRCVIDGLKRLIALRSIEADYAPCIVVDAGIDTTPFKTHKAGRLPSAAQRARLTVRLQELLEEEFPDV